MEIKMLHGASVTRRDFFMFFFTVLGMNSKTTARMEMMTMNENQSQITSTRLQNEEDKKGFFVLFVEKEKQGMEN